ncbi:MAG: hypothetical protein ACXWP5_14425, partial [Bdellovibrionota bacterium]
MKRSMKSLNLGLALLTLTAATAAMGDELSEQIVTKVSVGAGVTDQGPGVAAMFSSYGRSGGYLNVFTGKNWDNNDQYLRLQAGGEIGLKKRNYYRWGNFQQDFMSFDGQFTFKNLNSCNSDGSNQNDCVGTNGDMPNRQLDIVNALAGNTVGPHSNPTMNALYPFAGNGHLLIGLFPSSVAAGGARDAGHGFTVSGYARLGITAIKGGAS